MSLFGNIGEGLTNMINPTSGSGGISGSISPFSMVGSAADTLTNFLPQATELEGDSGQLAAGLQGAYDGIANAAMSIPPVGTVIGGIMKASNFLGRGLNALGGGTDGMTIQDAILGSPFFNLTPLGMINGFFGERADVFTKDQEVFSQMNSSYGGTSSQADVAARKSGKKYGLFSQGAMHDANRMMRKTEQAQNTIRNIQEETNDQNLLAIGMSQMKNNAYLNKLQGNYQQGLVRSAKNGSVIFNKSAIKRAKSLSKGSKINKILNTWPDYITEDKQFMKFLETCPDSIKNFSEENEILYELWQSNGKPINIEEANNSVIDMFVENEFGEFIINPELIYLDSIQKSPDNYVKDLLNKTQDESDESEEDTTLIFKDGGQLNVIPEGALHAEKHNLEKIDENLKGNITHKGIPVVSIDDEGNIEQQAEVERNELILNLETTELIEELRKKFHESESISKQKEISEEAGRIFAKSVIENTDDRTNLMETI